MSLSLLHNNIDDLKLLDWNLIIDELQSYAKFKLTKDRFNQPIKNRNFDAVQEDLNCIDHFLERFDDLTMLVNQHLLQIPSETLGFFHIDEIGKNKIFDAEELNRVAIIFEKFNDFFKDYTKNANDLKIKPDDDYIFSHYLKNFSTVQLQKISSQFSRPLRDFVDRSGTCFYEKHPLLKNLYAEILQIEKELRTQISQISKTEIYHERLQSHEFDVVHDRYVLSIRSDSYQSHLGRIIARSNSGMTLYVEPIEMQIRTEKRIQLLSEMDSIILRLTRDLSEQLFQFSEDFLKIKKFIIDFDFLFAKAHFSFEKNLCRPIIASSPMMSIQNLFHPLILNPVKNNVDIRPEKRGIIISGPNTGGKTVLLKSLALTLIFAHMGLYVPASFAEIYLFQKLFYFSHDHQDLSQGLSSFASESRYYLNLLQEIDDTNLILIDEIFNSTSSEEASALAMALLDELKETQTKILLSTHHQMLKTLMHSQQDFLSAHVGFDFETNSPTYKIYYGDPGSSLAFKIFERLQSQSAFKTNIAFNAERYLDQKHISYESLLQDLSFKKIELQKLLDHNKELNTQLKNQRQSMEGILFLEKEKIISEYRNKAHHYLKKAEDLFYSMKKEPIVSKKMLDQRIIDIERQLPKETNSQEITKEKYQHMQNLNIQHISENQTVFSMQLGKHVKTKKVNTKKNEVQIAHGNMTLWVSIDDLKASELNPQKSFSNQRDRVSINIDKDFIGKIEIDGRGMRLLDFQKAVEKSLDELHNGDIPFLLVIHGHGTGALKYWLRQTLEKEYDDFVWENVEGNDGCTKIELKK